MTVKSDKIQFKTSDFDLNIVIIKIKVIEEASAKTKSSSPKSKKPHLFTLSELTDALVGAMEELSIDPPKSNKENEN
jgi:hypothetical protein